MTAKAVRPLTSGEIALVRSIFADAIDTAAVRLHRRRWWPLQPPRYCMAPDGHLWFHPQGDLWSDDFAEAALPLRALFVHEMTHVWQAQARGRWYLPLMRHPFCRYRYTLRDGWPLARYGLEQQAEIVKHAWLARLDAWPKDERLEQLLVFRAPFTRSSGPPRTGSSGFPWR